MTRTSTFALGLCVLLLTACGGGGGGSDDPETGDTELTAVSSSNTLKLSQTAVKGMEGAEDGGTALSDASEAFGDMNSGDSEKTLVGVTSTVDCTDGNGSLSVESGAETVTYTATDCELSDGSIQNGTLQFTSGAWDDYPDGGMELVYEADFTSGDCSYSGAIAYRYYYDIPESDDGYGDYTLILEYATSGDGFNWQCTGGDSFALGANTSVRNELAYTLDSDGSLTDITNTVTTGGEFEAPDGSGTLQYSSQGLEYPVDDSGDTVDSQYGESICPTAGSVTITGADNTEASVYFGEDAPSGHEVQVMGPDGYVKEFETCDDFLSA